MSKLIASAFVSLDGVMQAPNRPVAQRSEEACGRQNLGDTALEQLESAAR